jgi:predicted Zn-dependent protease
MRPIRRILAAAFAGLLLVGCDVSTDAPPGAAERQFEQTQSTQILQDLRRKDLLWQDRQLDRYLAGIANRIDAQRPASMPDLKLHVIKDPDVNAFTTGAGHIFINAGMLALLENEAQLAMVLAHEAAHVDEGHVVEGMRQRQQVGLLGALAGIAGTVAGIPDEMVRLGVGLGQQYAVADFSRDQESEADFVGLRYLAGAGYNVRAGARSFEVMRRLYGEQGGVSQFFASHPRSSERQQEIERAAAQTGAEGGRVGEQAFLRATADVRRKALEVYRRAGRDKFADQALRNLRRMN